MNRLLKWVDDRNKRNTIEIFFQKWSFNLDSKRGL